MHIRRFKERSYFVSFMYILSPASTWKTNPFASFYCGKTYANPFQTKRIKKKKRKRELICLNMRVTVYQPALVQDQLWSLRVWTIYFRNLNYTMFTQKKKNYINERKLLYAIYVFTCFFFFFFCFLYCII